MNSRGTALMATLVIMMILLPLGAYVVLQCRTDLMIEHNFHAEIEAFYVAEAGLEHALAEIDATQSFDAMLAGPDGIAGSADDGEFPFREGRPGNFPAPPLAYDVRVTPAADNALAVVSHGSGRLGATKVVSALVTRSPLVFTPAALYTQADLRRIGVADRMLLSGFDHLLSDSPTDPNGAAPAVPALASADSQAGLDLRRQLPDDLVRQFLGAGGAPSIATTPGLDVQGYAARVAEQPTCQHLSDLNVQESAVLGTPRTPQLSFVRSNAQIAGRLSGNGLLVVQGTLEVAGMLEFTGLVIALGGVVVPPSGTVSIAGALWQGANVAGAPQLNGHGAIVYSSRALAAVEAVAPGLLPHTLLVTSWQEQL